jgi:hypothetical protein
LLTALMSSCQERWGGEGAAIAYQVFMMLLVFLFAPIPQTLLLRRHLGRWWLWWCGQYIIVKLLYLALVWLLSSVFGEGSYQVVIFSLFSFISMALCLWIIHRRHQLAS